MGFETTTHDCCIYKKVIDGNFVYLLWKIDHCACVCHVQKTAENIFNIIETKMRFKDEAEKGIIPFEFLVSLVTTMVLIINKLHIILKCLDKSTSTVLQNLIIGISLHK